MKKGAIQTTVQAMTRDVQRLSGMGGKAPAFRQEFLHPRVSMAWRDVVKLSPTAPMQFDYNFIEPG
jgi:hypothetical protein